MGVTSTLAAQQKTGRSSSIGFIGLGAMGAHMFNNLVTRSLREESKTHLSFVICDVNQKAIAQILAEHKARNPKVVIEAALTPKELAMKAGTIISMVPTSKHVREVYLGQDGVLSALNALSKDEIASTICIEESTIEQSESKDIASTLQEAGAEMVDAPVSGGVVGAKDGTLTIMVGGSTTGFEMAEQTLSFMSKKVVHCGQLGAGLAAKIANNMLLGISMVGVSEAMLLGMRLGVQPQILADIINTSTGHCWSSEVNNPVPEVVIEGRSPPAKRKYEGGFVTKLAHKDLAMAVSAAKSSGTPLAMGTLLEELYRPLAQPESKFANWDFSSIFKELKERSG